MTIIWIIALIFAILSALLFLIELGISYRAKEAAAVATVYLAIAAFPIMIALILEKLL